MFLQKRRSCEYRHCGCLARIAFALNRPSVFGQIQYTKPPGPENLCLLNKLLVLFPVRVLTWRCYMIGVHNFDFPKIMSVEQISLMPSWCLSLTNTRQDTRQYVTHHGSANQELADASARSNEQKGVLLAGVPYPLSPFPLLFSFLPVPYPFRRLLRRLPCMLQV